jgi:hypothetical protein
VRAADVPANEARDAGYSTKELMAAGYTVHELLEAGDTAAQLKYAGVAPSALLEAGVPLGEVVSVRFSASSLHDADVPANTFLFRLINKDAAADPVTWHASLPHSEGSTGMRRCAFLTS